MKLTAFENLLEKEMTRREFLIHLGVLLLVITGISGFLKTVSDPHIVTRRKMSKGFSAGSYGG